ncbi:MAG: hypothetical protein V9G22_17340 [Ottowia sp.]|jgi:hypothetical protein
MKTKFENLRANVREYGVPAVLAVSLSPLAAFAQSASGIDTEITNAKTEILGYIATWGGAFIAVALAGVGWKVGGKLIKRMAGAA